MDHNKSKFLFYKQTRTASTTTNFVDNQENYKMRILICILHQKLLLRKLRSVRWTDHAANMRGARKGYSIFITKPERKRPVDRPRNRWQDNITTFFKEKGY
jgi:hypothetical protein